MKKGNFCSTFIMAVGMINISFNNVSSWMRSIFTILKTFKKLFFSIGNTIIHCRMNFSSVPVGSCWLNWNKVRTKIAKNGIGWELKWFRLCWYFWDMRFNSLSCKHIAPYLTSLWFKRMFKYTLILLKMVETGINIILLNNKRRLQKFQSIQFPPWSIIHQHFDLEQLVQLKSGSNAIRK